MLNKKIDKFPLEFNLRLSAYNKVTNNLVAQATKHNVTTNLGRKWVRNLLGASSYATDPPTAIDPDALGNARVRYMGFGIGGINQTITEIDATATLATQLELAGVTYLEDPVFVNSSEDWLLEIEPQVLTNLEDFPDDYTIRFTGIISEDIISFTDNTAANSGIVVGTGVPISEAGLYISTADPTELLSSLTNTAALVAYATFSPIYITPNVIVRVEWELRT